MSKSIMDSSGKCNLFSSRNSESARATLKSTRIASKTSLLNFFFNPIPYGLRLHPIPYGGAVMPPPLSKMPPNAGWGPKTVQMW